MIEPKRFSEYTPITETDGTEILPILKDGENETVAAENLPMTTAVGNALLHKADKLLVDANGVAYVQGVTTDGWPTLNAVGDADAFLFGTYGGTII